MKPPTMTKVKEPPSSSSKGKNGPSVVAAAGYCLAHPGQWFRVEDIEYAARNANTVNGWDGFEAVTRSGELYMRAAKR